MDFITSAQAEGYDQWYETPLGRWVDRCEKEAVFALLPPLAGLRILDAGCGTGNFTLELAARGASVVGVDRSAAMLARAQARAFGGNGIISWVESDLLRLPFTSQCFDGVLVILSLDFIKPRAMVLQEVGRVLRSGGFLVVAALGRYSLWTLKRRVKAWFKPSLWRGVNFLRAADLTNLLQQAGFLHKFAWRRAVYCPPVNSPWLVKLGPLWERLGARLIPGAAAFLVVAARKKTSCQLTSNSLGKVKRNVVPCPSALSTQRRP